MGSLSFASRLMVVFMMVIMVQNMQGVMGFKEILVGGHKGWFTPDANDRGFYGDWAAKRRFHVGDSLRFQYQNDSVLVLDKYGYYHCDMTKATSTFNDGNTTIKLEQPGNHYFISGSPENCQYGQKLVVDVMSPHPSPIAAPPESHVPQAQSPAPANPNSGFQLSPMAQVSAFLGLVVASSVFWL